ncbi:GDP-mannose transporter GONST3 [Abeliophyllum distichum]|uniref:GDP-mannose transporter GONST3 n=1 Tax=Abeliophyllum distichum TaxID=126358 RepID=A0ABD1VSS7_9LAMI
MYFIFTAISYLLSPSPLIFYCKRGRDGLSRLFGLAIFGLSCRLAISATRFTVLGIMNKLLTVVINLVIWDKHSTFMGTLGLLICMIGGIMYQQSTSNKAKPVKEMKAWENDEEQQKLLEMQSIIGSNGHENQPTESIFHLINGLRSKKYFIFPFPRSKRYRCTQL